MLYIYNACDKNLVKNVVKEMDSSARIRACSSCSAITLEHSHVFQ